MAAAASLPREVVMRSRYNARFLEYLVDGGSISQGYLRFSKEDFTSPQSKFQVEPATSDPQLVHLRSSYNNKYLTAATETTRWIIPGSDHPEEDRSKWSCTLFRPARSPSGEDDFRFNHVRTGNYVALMKMDPYSPMDDCLFAALPHPLQDLRDVVTVIDWSSLLVLPSLVAFKADNDNYLKGRSVTYGRNLMEFASPDDRDPTVAHEVVRNPDGSIRVKSTHYNRFWRVDPHDPYKWVYSDVEGVDPTYINTHFWPVKVNRNIVALRSLGTNLFCKRFTALTGVSNCLAGSEPTISSFAQLQVTDLSRSREIYSVEFDLTRASKRDEHVLVMGTGEGSNTTNEAKSLDIKVRYDKPTTMRWNVNHSLSFGVKTRLVAKVPQIVDGKIELSPETTMLCEMGVDETASDTVEAVYNTLVPPMSKATVYAKGSCATFDVPFSCNQTDTYIDGMRRTRTLDDGTYTGVNCFNLFYEVEFENIDPTI